MERIEEGFEKRGEVGISREINQHFLKILKPYFEKMKIKKLELENSNNMGTTEKNSDKGGLFSMQPKEILQSDSKNKVVPKQLFVKKSSIP